MYIFINYHPKRVSFQITDRLNTESPVYSNILSYSHHNRIHNQVHFFVILFKIYPYEGKTDISHADRTFRH